MFGTAAFRSMKNIAYPRRKDIEVLRTLNEIVVSLDHIGSASYDMSKHEQLAALEEFISGHRIFHKTAKARQILSSAFSTRAGADGMDELEREMQNVRYWTAPMKKQTRRTKQIHRNLR